MSKLVSLNAPILAAWSIALIACSDAQQSMPELTAEEIIANHVDAMGGSEAYEALDNIRLSVNVVEPDFTVEGAYRATRDRLMRVDIYMEGTNVFSEGVDEEGAWQQAGEGSEPFAIEAEPAAILQRGADMNLRGLYDLAGRGHAARLDGREEIDGTNYYRLHVAFADGFERYYFINPESWMVERFRETSALHPDLDDEQRPAETVHSDFEEHCGVLQSMRSRKVDLETGEEIQSTRTTQFACNEDVADLQLDRTAPPIAPEG